MNNKKLYRTALIAAVLSTLGWVAYILGSSGMPDLAAANDSSHYIAMMREARPAMLLYGWGGVIGALFAIPYLVAFHEANEDAGTIRSVPVLIAVIGVVFTAVGFMSNSLSPVYFMLPAALEASTESLPQMLIAMEFAADASEAGWWVGSFMVYGVGVFWISAQAWQANASPKWVSAVGIAGGLAGIIWLRHFFPAMMPLTVPLSLMNIVALSVWAIGWSGNLVRRA